MRLFEYRRLWNELWNALGAMGNPEKWFLKIIQEWMRPDRSYHGIDHLGEGLIEFKEIRHLFDDPLAAELAWWLHDVIYDPKNALGENERFSADFAAVFLKSAGLHERFGEKIEKHILASIPGADPHDNDSALLCDLDIIRFAAPADVFWKISALVREEYHFAPQDVYDKNRAMILHLFIDREHVFRTKVFQDKYETQAQRNIRSALSRLEKRPS